MTPEREAMLRQAASLIREYEELAQAHGSVGTRHSAILTECLDTIAELRRQIAASEAAASVFRQEAETLREYVAKLENVKCIHVTLVQSEEQNP